MLGGYRREILGEAIVFGGIVWGLLFVVPCGFVGVLGAWNSEPGRWLVLAICLATAFVGYLAGAWRWQRVAAMVLEQRLAAGGDRLWNICESCRYSLEGLPLVGNRVVCPECGSVQLTGDWPQPRTSESNSKYGRRSGGTSIKNQATPTEP